MQLRQKDETQSSLHLPQKQITGTHPVQKCPVVFCRITGTKQSPPVSQTEHRDESCAKIRFLEFDGVSSHHRCPVVFLHTHRAFDALLNPLHVPQSPFHRVHFYDGTIAMYLGDAHEEFRDHSVTFDSPVVQVVRCNEVTAAHGLTMKASDLLQVRAPVLLFRPIPVRFVLYAKHKVDFVIDCCNNPLCHGTSAWFWLHCRSTGPKPVKQKSQRIDRQLSDAGACEKKLQGTSMFVRFIAVTLTICCCNITTTSSTISPTTIATSMSCEY